jgi:FixJ family two-component response regulator
MKIGAYDYVQKPFKHEDLLLTIERALATSRCGTRTSG